MNSRDAGFTLLEMIVALVVMSLVVFGAVQGVRLGIKSWSAQSRHIEITARIDGIDHVLRNLVHSIDVTQVEKIQGDQDRFTFVGSLPDAFPGPFRLALMTVGMGSDHRLVLRWQPYRHAAEIVVPRVTETELLRDVKSVRFAYQLKAPASAGWLASVSGVVPSLIRVQIVGDDSRHDIPDIVIAPVVLPQ